MAKPPTANHRWLILAVLFIARSAMGFQYQTIGSAAPFLAVDLHIGFAEIGTLIGLYHMAGVFLSMPSGLITRWVGDKTLCAIGLGLMACGGIIVAQAHRYGVAFAGRLLSSVGVILFNLVITKMTADWFARREIVLAMAVILSTWPFGIALGLFTQPATAAALGWRGMMLLAAGLCCGAMLLVGLCYRAPADETTSAQQSGTAVSAGAMPPVPVLLAVVAAGIMWGTFNAGLVVYFSFVPLFLTEHSGASLAASGALVSLALWVGMISIPLGGYFGQRSPRPNTVIVVFCLLAALALVGLVAGAPPALACIVLGLTIGPPPGVITALPTRIMGASQRAAGFGVFYTFHYLFQATGPAIAGWLQDSQGSDAAVLFAALMFALPVPLLSLHLWLAQRATGAAAAASLS